MLGLAMDALQRFIVDFGPLGPDKAKGGKYLFLPPGFDNAKIPSGYIPMPSDTYQGYASLRSVLKSGSDADVAKAVTYSKRIKLYLLSQASDPPATKFVDASGVLFDSTIRYDLSFFESLNHMVQAEPWLERDKAMIDQLNTIGIDRGKAFNPDKRTKEILITASIAKIIRAVSITAITKVM